MTEHDQENAHLVRFGLHFETPKGRERVVIDVGSDGYFNSDYIERNDSGEIVVKPGGTDSDSKIAKIIDVLSLSEILAGVDRFYKDYGGAPQEAIEMYTNFSRSAPRQMNK